MNVTTTDSFGNKYLNGFSNQLSPTEYRSFRDSETLGLPNFLQQYYTSSRFGWASIGNGYFFALLPSTLEGQATANGSYYRFRFNVGAGSYINRKYSSTTNNVASTVSPYRALGPFESDGSTAISGLGPYGYCSSGFRTFAVANSNNVCAARFQSNMTFATGGYVPTGFLSFGWLDDPIPFSASSPYRTSVAYIIAANAYEASSSGYYTYGYHCEQEADGFDTPIRFLTSGSANYSVTCQSGATPTSTWATNLVLIDSTASPQNYAMGSVPNLLLGKGSLTIGQVYKVAGVGRGEANTNPNTEQEFFICCGNWGTDKLLMRVATEGYQ